METIGFIISHKNEEKRRALIPDDIKKIKNANNLFFEIGYGEIIGYSDEEYTKQGANIVTRKDVLSCDIIVDVKLGDADFLDDLPEGKILVGWAHAIQSLNFTKLAMKGKHTVIAWEEIFEHGQYLFFRNREIAGEAAILHAFRYSGLMPYDTKVAIIGNGQTAKGAMRILHGLGAHVDVFGRKLETLFKKTMYNYDVIVNCVMWNTTRTDRLIYKEDLKKMEKGTLIIDVSCDPFLEIETSHPTTIDNPVYTVDDVIHYSVDNTPALFPKTVTKVISKCFCKYVDQIIDGNYSEPIENAIVIKKGILVDKRIISFRKERGLNF